MEEPNSGVEKVTQWQNSMYNVDSGIHSRATTIRGDEGHYTMTTTTVTSEEPRESPQPPTTFTSPLP